MEYALLVSAAIQLARDLVARGRQTGELTDEQQAALEAEAELIFAGNATPAPPPAGA